MFDHIAGDFIIESNHFSGESIVGEYSVAGFECSNKVTGSSGLDGDCVDIIAIVIEHDKDVFVSPCGGNWVSAR